jgi:hypothetical protein
VNSVRSGTHFLIADYRSLATDHLPFVSDAVKESLISPERAGRARGACSNCPCAIYRFQWHSLVDLVGSKAGGFHR